MNKAITDGLVLMPPEFSNNLSVWSRGDGTPGSASYQGASDAAFVPADQDFGGCLEVQKTQGVQKLRYKGETPLLRGCYLRVRARVKAVSGSLPRVRIAGYAAGAAGQPISGIVTTGPEVPLTAYGRVVEVSAIIGIGDRPGVDLSWGAAAIYGHFGLDLVGLNGGVVRVDDLVIEDITSVFLRDMISTVDVRDYGAIGDGATDDSAAFEAAAADADGREVLVPKGVYRLGSTVTLHAPVRFEGQVVMPQEAQLLLPRSFDLPTYIDAFGDEELGFKKAVQALFNNVDHDALDMKGRKVTLRGPVDIQDAVVSKTAFDTRRVIRNGLFEAAESVAWQVDTVVSAARYDPADPRRLSDVAGVEAITPGALVEGAGVGREIYVRAKNEATQELTLNLPLYGADGTQDFTLTAFQPMLDFSGFSRLSHFAFENVELQCNGRASGVRLAASGEGFGLYDCAITRPRDRGVMSTNRGCEGLRVSRCRFVSDEVDQDVSARRSVALNVNSERALLSDCVAQGFRHFAVIGGEQAALRGNDLSQGDAVPDGVRSAGIVLTQPLSFAVVSGNQITDCFVEWTNEHRVAAAASTQAFRGVMVSDNLFKADNVAPWFSFIVLKPIGTGHYPLGVSITGNVFRSKAGSIDRAERLDESMGAFDRDRYQQVAMHSNSFLSVTAPAANPAVSDHQQSSAAATWVVDGAGALPFDARVQRADAVVAQGVIKDDTGAALHEMPHVLAAQGATGQDLHLIWSTAVKGRVGVTLRGDR
ncbi:MAG: right-handed parallel beta-helix repeat-containing protein [Marinibacterium sp.]|nr:right-handed parallel beta-helix repeat-containing protein [Marinibacterium sp.]